jgi:hypothetical protein
MVSCLLRYDILLAMKMSLVTLARNGFLLAKIRYLASYENVSCDLSKSLLFAKEQSMFPNKNYLVCLFVFYSTISVVSSLLRKGILLAEEYSDAS